MRYLIEQTDSKWINENSQLNLNSHFLIFMHVYNAFWSNSLLSNSSSPTSFSIPFSCIALFLKYALSSFSSASYALIWEHGYPHSPQPDKQWFSPSSHQLLIPSHKEIGHREPLPIHVKSLAGLILSRTGIIIPCHWDFMCATALLYPINIVSLQTMSLWLSQYHCSLFHNAPEPSKQKVSINIPASDRRYAVSSLVHVDLVLVSKLISSKRTFSTEGW